MKYYDDELALYYALRVDYLNWRDNNNQGSNFEMFMNQKDIGLRVIEFKVFEIVDEKKWLLNKIKYNIL
jgi:hypothetical protein